MKATSIVRTEQTEMSRGTHTLPAGNADQCQGPVRDMGN